MRAVVRFVVVVLALVVTTDCKRETVPASASSSSGNSAAPAGNASATGPGALSVNGNEVTFQNVHIEVPWDASDVAGLVKMSQDAAGGAGLRLSDGKNTLLIASDGRSTCWMQFADSTLRSRKAAWPARRNSLRL